MIPVPIVVEIINHLTGKLYRGRLGYHGHIQSLVSASYTNPGFNAALAFERFALCLLDQFAILKIIICKWY